MRYKKYRSLFYPDPLFFLLQQIKTTPVVSIDNKATFVRLIQQQKDVFVVFYTLQDKTTCSYYCKQHPFSLHAVSYKLDRLDIK